MDAERPCIYHIQRTISSVAHGFQRFYQVPILLKPRIPVTHRTVVLELNNMNTMRIEHILRALKNQSIKSLRVHCEPVNCVDSVLDDKVVYRGCRNRLIPPGCECKEVPMSVAQTSQLYRATGRKIAAGVPPGLVAHQCRRPLVAHSTV